MLVKYLQVVLTWRDAEWGPHKCRLRENPVSPAVWVLVCVLGGGEGGVSGEAHPWASSGELGAEQVRRAVCLAL